MSLVGKGRFSNAVVAPQIELGALLVSVVLLQSSNPLWEPLRPVEGQRAFESGAPISCSQSNKLHGLPPPLFSKK